MRAVLPVLLLAGCYTRVEVSGADVPGDDAPFDAPSRPDVPLDSPPDVPIDSRDRDLGPPFDAGMARVACRGVMCEPGQACCLLDGRCTTPGEPSCRVPAGAPAGTCASNADCNAAELCALPRWPGSYYSYCRGGLGECIPRPSPSDCGPSAQACGCDGRTYPSACVAATLGVPVVLDAACGASPTDSYHQACVTPGEDPLNCGDRGVCDPDTWECYWIDVLVACANDGDCRRPGDVCCSITGTCHDPDVPGTCAIPPEGTVFPCASDADCRDIDGTGFCDAASCTGPGGCIRVPSSCTGTLAPVCGCDGRSYTNECEAHRAHVRVDHEGACS